MIVDNAASPDSGTKRSRLTAWLGRRYLARLGRTGFDLDRAWFVPKRVLAPLRRNGLDPVPELLRTRGPLTRLPLPVGVTVWLVTGHEAAQRVLVDVETFSNDFDHLTAVGLVPEQEPGGLGFSDPPDHTRLRRILTPEFTLRRLARLGPRIDAIVTEHLDRMATVAGPVDLVEAYALPIPALTICELLGVPVRDRQEFQQRSLARFDLAGPATSSLSAVSESITYFRELVRSQRRTPGSGLLGELVRQHGDDLSDDELAGLADGLLTGGFETTASMISLGVLAMLRQPHLFDRMRHDPTAVDPLVEELLRHHSVVQVAFPRVARRDTEIAGRTIRGGDIVVCSLSAANRDPSVFTAPGEIEPDRTASKHIAFGYGAHRCVGAELARMELRAAYPALVRRFPRMRAAVRQEELSFRGLSIVYGLHSLPVVLR